MPLLLIEAPICARFCVAAATQNDRRDFRELEIVRGHHHAPFCRALCPALEWPTHAAFALGVEFHVSSATASTPEGALSNATVRRAASSTWIRGGGGICSDPE